MTKAKLRKMKKIVIDAMDSFEKKKSNSPVMTYFELASRAGLTTRQLKDYLEETREDKMTQIIKDAVNNSFYMLSISNKITKGIEMYINNELIVEDPIAELKVIVDINDYQKELQPFTINQKQPSVEIQNPRDEIISIDLTDEELEEMGVVVEDIDGGEDEAA